MRSHVCGSAALVRTSELNIATLRILIVIAQSQKPDIGRALPSINLGDRPNPNRPFRLNGHKIAADWVGVGFDGGPLLGAEPVDCGSGIGLLLPWVRGVIVDSSGHLADCGHGFAGMEPVSRCDTVSLGLGRRRVNP